MDAPRSLRPATRIALVAAGYLAAAALAGLAVTLFGNRGDGGMEAFGDLLLFLAAFALASLPATVVALIWLRPCPRFWRSTAVVALLVAASGVLAAVNLHSLISPLRILLAPLLLLSWALAGALAPNRSSRWMLLGAAAVEALAFAWAVRQWLSPHG